MAKNLNLQMTVTADTSQAKREMQSLQDQLSKLGKNIDFGKGFGDHFIKETQKAKNQIAELQVALQSATNIDTGKLDFTKFNQQLKRSGSSLADYGKTLTSLGTEGQQAFIQLARAVSASEVPIVRVSKTLKEMGNTLTNTLRWQISSSVLHGFIGAVQQAYGYAKDLNESLNNIRIVTNLDTQAMAQFAEQANTAAQALGTSTLNYTDAALIYYQQGIRDQEEIAARTETTIKLANVTKASAEEVSSQMTAIWNNFYDGSESLESYADKITALGAATASSSAEIAQGLEKFAAVADTVGLSYDQATAALATVVAQTRQSADIVGTAFKTLFARLESLNLGETLDDGVTLNKYSKALETVGVNIFQANGELKDMDDILDDLGSKWETLDKNSKVALAQTVGGMRQYNQLIALMDNYDFFKQNLSVAQGAEGALQQQQDIYAESWEASTKRVKAAWESLYNDIIKDDFFITLNDELAKFLGNLDKFIDSLGGVQGLLITLSPLIYSAFGDKIQTGIQNFTSSIAMMVPGARQKAIDNKNAFVVKGINQAIITGDESSRIKLNQELEQYEVLEKYGDQLTQQDKDHLAILRDQKIAQEEINSKRLEELNILEAQIKKEEQKQEKNLSSLNLNDSEINELEKYTTQKGQVLGAQELIGGDLIGKYSPELISKITILKEDYLKDLEDENNEIKNTIDEIEKNQEDLKKENLSQKEILEKQNKIVKLYNQIANLLENETKTLGEKSDENIRDLVSKNLKGNIEENNKGKRSSIIDTFHSSQTGIKTRNSANIWFENNKNFTGTKEELEGLIGKTQEYVDSLKKTKKTKGLTEVQQNALDKYTKVLKDAKSQQEKLNKAEEKLEEEITETAGKVAEQAGNIGIAEAKQRLLEKEAIQSEDNTDSTKSLEEITEEILEKRKNAVEGLNQSIGGLTQSMTSLGSAYFQATSIMNIWDEVAKGNVDSSQALIQTVTTLGMLIPTLSNGIKGLKTTFEGLKMVRTALEGVTKKGIKATLEYAVAKAVLAKEGKDVTKTELIEAHATGQLGKNLGTLTLQTLEANKGMIVLAVAIAAIAIVVHTYQEGMEELNQTIEDNKKKQEELNKTYEENKGLLEQVENLKELERQYKEGTVSKEDYNKAILETAKNLNIENAELQAQADAYDYLNNKIEEAKKNKIAEQQSNLAQQGAALRGNAIAADYKNNMLENLTRISKPIALAIANPALAGLSTKFSEQTGLSLYDEQLNYNWNEMSDKQALEQAQQMQKYLNLSPALQTNSDYLNYINKFSETVGGLDNYVSQLEKVVNEFSYNMGYESTAWFENATSLTDYQNSLEGLTGATEKYGSDYYDVSKVREGALSAISEMDSVGVSFYKLSKISEESNIDFKQLITSINSLNLSDKELEETTNKLLNKQELFAAVYRNTNNDIEKTLEILQVELKALDLNTLTNDITSFIEAIKSLTYGSILDPKNFETLKEKFEALGLKISEFGRTTADGSFVVTSSIEDMKHAMAGATSNKINDFYNTFKNEGAEGAQALIEKMLNGQDQNAVQAITNATANGVSLEELQEASLDAYGSSYRDQYWGKEYGPGVGRTEEESLEELYDGLKRVIAPMLGKTFEEVTKEELNHFFNIQNTGSKYIAESNEDAFYRYNQTIQGGEENLEGIKDLATITEYKKLLDALATGEGYGDLDLSTLIDSSLIDLDTLEEIYRNLNVEAQKNIDINKQLEKVILANADAYGINAKELENNAEYLAEYNIQLYNNKEAALDVAFAYARLEKGIQDLGSNFDSYKKSLDPTLEGTKEYTDALEKINSDLKNVFSTNEDVDTSFILNNLDLIKKASTGDAEAIRDLGNAYVAFENQALNESQAFASTMKMSFSEAMSEMDKLDNEFTFGMTLDNSEFMKQLLDAMVAAGYSSEQINKALEKTGWSGELRFEEVDDFDANGNKIGSHKQLVGLDSVHYTRNKVSVPKTKSSSKGKGKSRSKKDQKELKDEFERYYTISRQLQDQIDLLDKLGKAKDRAWGKAKLEYIEKETKALEDELTIQEKYLKEIQDYYKEDQKNLNFFGAKYDENGVVTNYDEMIKKELDRYNAAVKKYNAGGSEAAFSKAEQRYEDFKKKLKQYDDTNELYQKKLEEIQELQYQIYDKELEKITTKVEMDIQVNDAELKKLEYDLDRIQKKAFATAEAIAKLSDQLSVNLDSQSSYQEGLENILANHGINNIDEISGLSEDEIANLGFTEDEVNTLLDYNDSLIDMQNTIDELQETIMHGMVDAFEEWNKEFDYQQDKIATNIDLLKQYQDIADLIYSNASGVTDEFITNLMESQYAQMVNGVDAAYNRLDVQKKALEEARAEYENLIASGASEQTLTAFRNDLREMEAEVEKSQSDMLKKTEEALKQAEDIFKNAVENMTKIYQQMTHTTDWDMTQFDRLKKLDDEYLDDYEKIYELSKLTRDVNNSIDDMDTIRAKERLKEITQEIADIEASGKEVSQYEVDALRKKYELRLAEIALEDAQAAKQTVRMSRDNDGNWSYIYTADNDNVDKARQNYEDKLYEYQKLNSEFIKEQQENFLKLEQEYVDAMTKIAEDSSLNQEDKENRLRETQEYYQRMADIMSDQLGIALNRNSELYTKDWLDYSKNTGYKISKEEEYQTKLQNTYTGVLQPNIESATELLAQFTEATVGDDGFFPAIITALDEFNTKQDEVLNAAGTSLEDYSKLVSNVMKETAQGSQDAADTVRVSAEEMKDAFDQVIAKIKELNGKKLDGLRSDVDTTVNAVNKLISTYKQLSNAIDSYNNKQNNSGVNSATYKASPTNNSSTGGKTNSSAKITVSKNSLNAAKTENLAEFLMGVGLDQSYSSISAMTEVAKNIPAVKTLVGSNKQIKDLEEWIRQNLTDSDINKLRQYGDKQYSRIIKQYGSFDTGGYTGAWGTEGRLAMLHQKELVLNAHDTENMLNTIQMVRDIVASIDTRAAAASVANISAGYAGATAGGPQTLDQNVHIEANFPNVTDHNEIELAITGLVNRASQYVGRKKL